MTVTSSFRFRIRTSCLSLIATAALALGSTLPAPARADQITVFAAASLKNALDAIAADWKADTGNSVAISFAGSSLLARQIGEGAPAQVFISADVKWMDYV
ncbi:molybdate ABC transporter substrate-binding protein, partial [Thioclava sp. BHET1]